MLPIVTVPKIVLDHGLRVQAITAVGVNEYGVVMLCDVYHKCFRANVDAILVIVSLAASSLLPEIRPKLMLRGWIHQ